MRVILDVNYYKKMTKMAVVVLLLKIEQKLSTTKFESTDLQLEHVISHIGCQPLLKNGCQDG